MISGRYQNRWEERNVYALIAFYKLYTSPSSQMGRGEGGLYHQIIYTLKHPIKQVYLPFFHGPTNPSSQSTSSAKNPAHPSQARAHDPRPVHSAN